jgi:hypothetical protein
MGAFGNRTHNPTWYRSLVPIAGTAGRLRIKLDVMPGVGKSYQFNFQLNGVTQFSVTISGTATTGFSASTFACAAADYLTVVAVPSGTPAAAYAYWCWTWEPTTADKTMVCGYTDIGQLPGSGTRYLAFSGADAGPQTVAAYARLYMPIAGVFSNFHVLLSAAPGVGANARVFTWQKNGSNQTLTVTIGGLNTTGSDTSNSFSVAAGDYVNLRATSPGRDAAPAACFSSIAAVFTPTIPTHFLVGNCGSDILPSGTVTEYGQFASGSITWNATANTQFNCTHRVQVVAMRAKISLLPSSGTWDIQTDTLNKGPSVQFTSTSATELASRRLHNWQDGDLPIMVCGATGVGAPVSTRLSCCLACRAVPVHGTGFPL